MGVGILDVDGVYVGVVFVVFAFVVSLMVVWLVIGIDVDGLFSVCTVVMALTTAFVICCCILLCASISVVCRFSVFDAMFVSVVLKYVMLCSSLSTVVLSLLNSSLETYAGLDVVVDMEVAL